MTRNELEQSLRHANCVTPEMKAAFCDLFDDDQSDWKNMSHPENSCLEDVGAIIAVIERDLPNVTWMVSGSTDGHGVGGHVYGLAGPDDSDQYIGQSFNAINPAVALSIAYLEALDDIEYFTKGENNVSE